MLQLDLLSYLRESSSQFLEVPWGTAVPKQAAMGLHLGLALLCSLTRRSREVAAQSRPMAFFSPLHTDVHFCVLRSPVSSKTLPLISSSLPR